MTLNAIRKTLAQLDAKRRALEDEITLTAKLALPFHPWNAHRGKYVRYLGFLYLISATHCSAWHSGQINFVVLLRRVSPRTRRLVVSPVRSINITLLEGCEVLP